MRTITAVLLLLSAFGVRAEWDRVGTSVSGNTFYLDFSTIKKTAVGYRVWELVNFTEREYGAYSSKTLWEYDCNEERLRSLQTSELSEPMGEGAVVDGKTSPSQWHYVEPQSAGETLLKIVCSRKNRR
jgi:hypothetical protein